MTIASTRTVISVLPLALLTACGPESDQVVFEMQAHGREIFFGSTRLYGAGGLDVWFSTRRSVHDAWSPPENLAPLNSVANDQQPSLSSDGRTLVFASDRLGSIGGTDIWMAARTPRGH